MRVRAAKKQIRDSATSNKLRLVLFFKPNLFPQRALRMWWVRPGIPAARSTVRRGSSAAAALLAVLVVRSTHCYFSRAPGTQRAAARWWTALQWQWCVSHTTGGCPVPRAHR
eukprot:COSAG02_NODE_1358_length_13076_cov_6.377745_7_plen_112_part_00